MRWKVEKTFTNEGMPNSVEFWETIRECLSDFCWQEESELTAKFKEPKIDVLGRATLPRESEAEMVGRTQVKPRKQNLPSKEENAKKKMVHADDEERMRNGGAPRSVFIAYNI